MTEQFINEELFRPMRTTKNGGFGIGAYQARELMRDLGGDIMIASRIGHGTTVTLSLPRGEQQGNRPG
jgi:signal transduction histidine kinase